MAHGVFNNLDLGFVKNANTPEEHTLLAFRIRVTSVHQYDAALVMSNTGVYLRVQQDRGNQRRKIEIPAEFFENLQDAFNELLDKIFNSTRGKT